MSDCHRLYKGREVEIPIDDIAAEAVYCDLNADESICSSYSEFVRFFSGSDPIRKHHFIIGASCVYSWMQTTLSFKSLDRQDDCVLALEKVRGGQDLECDEICLLKEVVNRSMIGTSKLLHFVNPELYPIYDSWIDFYLYGSESEYRQNHVGHYLSYTRACRRAVDDTRFAKVYPGAPNGQEPTLSRLRVLELIMFLTAKRRGKK